MAFEKSAIDIGTKRFKIGTNRFKIGTNRFKVWLRYFSVWQYDNIEKQRLTAENPKTKSKIAIVSHQRWLAYADASDEVRLNCVCSMKGEKTMKTKMQQKKKRLLGLVLMLCMVVGLLPVMPSKAEAGDGFFVYFYNQFAPDPTVIEVNNGWARPWPVPYEEGYIFEGWYTSGGIEMKDYNVFNKTTYLYSKFSKNLINICITLDYGYGGKKESAYTNSYGKISLITPSRDGYTFMGWFTDKEWMNEVNGNKVYEEETTLYARWEKNPIIAFYRNDGSYSVYDEMTTDSNGRLSKLPEGPTRDKYAFLGWYTDINGGKRVSISTEFTKDTSVYAHWEKMVTITFRPQGYNGTLPAPQIIPVGGTLKEIPDLPSPQVIYGEQCFFEGWYLIALERCVTNEDTFEDDLNLYARWSMYESTIQFDLNGMEGTAPPPQTTKNRRLTSLPQPQRVPGYTFIGWYEYENLTSYNPNKWWITTDYVFTWNTTVHAIWEETKHTIRFDLNGGDGTPPASMQTSAGVLDSLPTPTRKDYRFNGWYTTRTGGTKISTDTVFDKNTTLYARWIKAKNTITFDLNGAPGTAPASMTTTDGRLAKLPVSPTWAGYTFNGWYTAKTGGTRISTAMVFDKDTTVYARWKKVPVGVTVSGKIEASGDTTDLTTVVLSGAKTYTVTGTDSYSFKEIPAGKYTMTVRKTKHCDRTYKITVGTKAVTQDVEIWLYGDVNHDTLVNAQDATQINRYAANMSSVFNSGDADTQAYRKKVADVNGAGGVNAQDATQINRHAANMSSVFNKLP